MGNPPVGPENPVGRSRKSRRLGCSHHNGNGPRGSLECRSAKSTTFSHSIIGHDIPYRIHGALVQIREQGDDVDSAIKILSEVRSSEP